MLKKIVICLIIIIGHSYGREVKSIPLSKANNYFGLKLLQQLYEDHKNVFFSPLSISTAFGILYYGAKGKTYEQMKEGLGYNSVRLSDKQIGEQFSETLIKTFEGNSKNCYLTLANRIIAQNNSGVLRSFDEIVYKYYKSEIELMDFSDDPIAIMKEINEWVAKQTKDKIKEILVKPLNVMTRMVILNAIYFKGIFQTKFDKQLTRDQDFYNSGHIEKEVKMMKSLGKFNYTEIDELESKLLEIPYSGDEISLYIVLPKQRDGFTYLRDKLKDFSIIEEGIGKLREQEVMVMVPKFKIETTYALNKKLSDLGMKSIFTKSADLSAINGHKNLYVSEAIHKAFVEVNEEGTEAAAATAIRIQAKSMPLPSMRKTQFRADHPFLFFIRNNKNGVILFCGHINQL